jgi:hypothetical protein
MSLNHPRESLHHSVKIVAGPRHRLLHRLGLLRQGGAGLQLLDVGQQFAILGSSKKVQRELKALRPLRLVGLLRQNGAEAGRRGGW